MYALHVGEISIILRSGHELGLLDAPQQLHRIVLDRIPQLSIQPPKQFDGVRLPDPPEIVSQLHQGSQRLGDVGKNLKSSDIRRINAFHSL